MSNKHDRTVHYVHRPLGKSDVVFRCVERVLRRNAIVALRLQRPHHFGKARAVGPKTMTENYAGLARAARRRSHFRLRRCKRVALIAAALVARNRPRLMLVFERILSLPSM